MRTFQAVHLIGRLGADAELHYTPQGQAVARLRIATDRPTREGVEPESDWHTVVCWGKLGEFAGAYLTRGRLVFAVGRLTYRAWEGRDGQKRTRAEIVASELIPLDHRPAETESADSDPEEQPEPDGDLPL